MTITDEEITAAALEAGIMLHTGYGQASNKQMPVSDVATLKVFAQLLQSTPQSSDAQVREAVHAWIKNTACVAIKISITPEQSQALVKALPVPVPHHSDG